MNPEKSHVRLGNRLALYSVRASRSFWDDSWHQIADRHLERILRPTRFLAPSLGRFLLRWLPKDGVVLEAGCGTGLVVRRLCMRGYNCVGLDYALSTLARSKRVCADLSLVGGDIFRLPINDGGLSGIVSLGVLEHFREGPALALKEAARVLKSGGVICLTVPQQNYLRQNLATVTEDEAMSRGLEFYQYYFSREDMASEMGQAGLWPISSGTFSAYKGLRDDCPAFRTLSRVLPRPAYWSFALDLVPGLSDLVGHMMYIVAVKP